MNIVYNLDFLKNFWWNQATHVERHSLYSSKILKGQFLVGHKCQLDITHFNCTSRFISFELHKPQPYHTFRLLIRISSPQSFEF